MRQRTDATLVSRLERAAYRLDWYLAPGLPYITGRLLTPKQLAERLKDESQTVVFGKILSQLNDPWPRGIAESMDCSLQTILHLTETAVSVWRDLNLSHFVAR